MGNEQEDVQTMCRNEVQRMRTQARIRKDAVLRTIGIGFSKAGIDSQKAVNVSVRPNVEAALNAEDEDEEDEQGIRESRAIKGKEECGDAQQRRV